jgi:hypothetical protein
MSIPEKLANLTGKWIGTNRLHMPWKVENPLHESRATAEVRARSGDQFLEISYTWVYEDKPREGVLLLGREKTGDRIEASWTDSWHMAHQLMHCEGRETENGGISVKGSYKVEGHPDWGWRTEIVPGSGSFRYLMYNVSPEGEEEIAVEMDMSPA